MATANKILKIGFVFDDSLDKPDGVQQYVLSVGSWLASQGHEVHYLVGSTNRSDIPRVHSLSRNLSVKFNGNGMSMPLPTSRRALAAFLATHNFDVLHVQVPYSPWLAGRIIRLASPRTAVVGTFHIVAISPLVTAATRLLALYTRRPSRRFDRMLSVSKAAQAFAQQTYGLTSEVIPNAIDYTRFQTAQPLAEYRDSTPTILFLGRLVPRKGCAVLLEAVRALKAAGQQNFRVLICGKGPELPALERFVARHDLGGLVRFVGFVSEQEKPAYYASADIAVFPSSGGESFGIVLVEAMASGRAAVLAGDNSGYRTVMSERPELLFKATDSAALAEKLTYYLCTIAARRAAAAWGTAYARQFDQAVVGRQLLEVYDQALQKRRPQDIL